MKQFIFLTLFIFNFSALQAQEIHAISTGTVDLTDMINNGVGKLVDGNGFEVELTATCFARNLRSVSNPIGKNTRVEATLNFPTAASDNFKSMEIQFPSKMVTNSQVLTELNSVRVFDKDKKLVTSASAALSGNVLRVNIPGLVLLPTPAEPSGNINYSKKTNQVDSITFNQTVNGYASTPVLDASGNPVLNEEGQPTYELSFNDDKPTPTYVRYYASDGALTGKVYHNLTNNGSKLEIHAAFPGENGFCGGYYSPLALFFEKGFKQAKMQGSSHFKLNPKASTIYWPSPEDQTYFLAHDKNKDGVINDGNELFGHSEKHKNGFESLAQWDKNKDGSIDSKDPVFKELSLWWDKNGNGVCEKQELKPLSSRKVKSISLKYDDSRESNYGNRARARERSHFTYEKNGKLKKSDIVDLWFSPKVHMNYVKN